jgi:hypothetical protein
MLRSLRGDTARLCAIGAALARALASGWEGPTTLEISGARACGRRELEAAVVQGTLGKCARLAKLHLECISFDLTPQGVQLAGALVACTRLQELRLSGCRFEEQASPAAFFSTIAQAKILESTVYIVFFQKRYLGTDVSELFSGDTGNAGALAVKHHCVGQALKPNKKRLPAPRRPKPTPETKP